MDEAALRCAMADFADLVFRVAQRDGIERRLRCEHMVEAGKTRLVEQRIDDLEPFRALRVAGRVDVVEAGRMGHEKRGHAALTLDNEEEGKNQISKTITQKRDRP